MPLPLSLRKAEDLLHKRGVDVSNETIRLWGHRFGPSFATWTGRNSATDLTFMRLSALVPTEGLTAVAFPPPVTPFEGTPVPGTKFAEGQQGFERAIQALPTACQAGFFGSKRHCGFD